MGGRPRVATSQRGEAGRVRWEFPLVAALAGLVFVVNDVAWLLDQPFRYGESWVVASTKLPLGDLPDATASTPIGFTVLLRAVAWGGEQRYRLLPLGFSCASVVAAYCLARLLAWRDRRQAVLAGVLAGGAALLIPAALHRNDLKQYTAEAFTAVLVLALTANVERSWSRRSLGALAAGVVGAKLVSHPAVFVGSAAFISLCLVAVADRDWRRARAVLAAGAVSAAGILTVYLAFDRRSPSNFLHDYWRGFFPPTNRGVDGVWDYVVHRYDTLEGYLGLGDLWLASSLVLAGLVTLFLVRRRAVALTIPVLLLELLVAGLSEAYPLLDLRTSHFLLVTLAVIAAIGVAGLAALVGRRSFLLSLGVAALAGGLYLHQASPLLRTHEMVGDFGQHLSTDSAYVASHRRPGDAILLNVWASFGFGYYWQADRPGLIRNPSAEPGWSVTYPTRSGVVVVPDGTREALTGALRKAWRIADRGTGRLWVVRAIVLGEETPIWGEVLRHYRVHLPMGDGEPTLLPPPVAASDLGSNILLLQRPIPSRELRRARLRRQDDGRLVLSWLGRDVAVTHDAVQGSVDDLSVADGLLTVQGWAADVERRQPADWILVFASGRLIAANSPTRDRPDIAKAFGRRLVQSGYTLTSRKRRATARAKYGRLRVVVVRGNEASALALRGEAKRLAGP